MSFVNQILHDTCIENLPCLTDFCTTSETEGEVVHVKLVWAPWWFITGRSRAVVLLWFSVACFWCQSFGVRFALHVHIISSWGLFPEWPPFGK